MPTVRTLAPLLGLVLAGCLNTRAERIVVRRAPEDLLRQRTAQKLTYEEYLEQRKNEAQALEWDLGRPTPREAELAEEAGTPTRQPAEGLWAAVPPYAIRESLRDDEARHEAIQPILDSIQEDPWRDYEQERRDTLWRDWGDRYSNQPKTLEPDTDGPPGWLGPKALPALPAAEKKPAAGEAAEEGAAE
jgi:hypothetical protein